MMGQYGDNKIEIGADVGMSVGAYSFTVKRLSFIQLGLYIYI